MSGDFPVGSHVNGLTPRERVVLQYIAARV